MPPISNAPVRISIEEATCQTIWVSSDDGQAVFEAVAGQLRAGHLVSLSFAGRAQVITAFLNVAIGQLYSGSIPWNELDARLSFEDLGDGDREKIDMVILNAKRYFQQRSQQQSL